MTAQLVYRLFVWEMSMISLPLFFRHYWKKGRRGAYLYVSLFLSIISSGVVYLVAALLTAFFILCKPENTVIYDHDYRPISSYSSVETWFNRDLPADYGIAYLNLDAVYCVNSTIDCRIRLTVKAKHIDEAQEVIKNDQVTMGESNREDGVMRYLIFCFEKDNKAKLIQIYNHQSRADFDALAKAYFAPRFQEIGLRFISLRFDKSQS